jgi:hypothetical protein
MLSRYRFIPLAAGLLAAHPVGAQEPQPAADAGVATQPTVEDLLRRIEALEKQASEKSSAPVSPPPTSAGPFSQVAFNPELSIITDVGLFGATVADADAPGLEIPGFITDADRLGKSSGFNLNSIELAFNAAVDPFFDFTGILTFGAEGFDLEEVYAETRTLPAGFRLRVGKFLSGFGRLNGQHQHVWDFYDPPLVYETLLGMEGLKSPGVRLSWTAPLDFLLTANVEVLQGVDEEARTYNAVGYSLTATDGTTLSRSQPFTPGLYTGSIKASFDVGQHVFLLGASVMYGHSTRARVDGADTDLAFYAPGTVLYGAELTYKLLISSYQSLTWQTEYLGRVSTGELALASDALAHRATSLQGGFYSQLVWRFDPAGQWRVGARFDLLTQNQLLIDEVDQPLDGYLQRYSAMMEFNPSEFARFRLQYAFDRARYLAGVRTDVHELLLQINFSVGPHGAHFF